MCVNDSSLKCVPRDDLSKRQKNLCNEQLAINRDIICAVLASYLPTLEKPVKCLEGVGICGINGMLWEKHFGNDVDVTINGYYNEDYNVITKNLESNNMKGKVVKEDPCVLLRKQSFDFIYLNCKTNASCYFDSLFSNIKDNAIFLITTSDDSSLYWQISDTALRNYGGLISKTSYSREVAVRLVVAEMARVAAKYSKGIQINCCIGYKPQQSFTIIGKVIKGVTQANESIQKIQKLAHCSICENRKFISNSIFLDKVNNELSCTCSKESEGKVVVGIGPLWAGDIFNVKFIESVFQYINEFPWSSRVYSLLKIILEEARCEGSSQKHPPPTKIPKLANDDTNSDESSSSPCFYINTHRHSSKKFHLEKLQKITDLLKKNGFRASRTHFDSEAVRTNASVADCVRILNKNAGDE